jgi:hypothetical protein
LGWRFTIENTDELPVLHRYLLHILIESTIDIFVLRAKTADADDPADDATVEPLLPG